MDQSFTIYLFLISGLFAQKPQSEAQSLHAEDTLNGGGHG
jgi:hypothetical protein